MPSCPHCGKAITGEDLRQSFSLRPYRACPFCKGLFTVDGSTKRRQAFGIVLALISMVLTLALHDRGVTWLAPAIVSYIFLGLFVYWGNRHVMFVPYSRIRSGSKRT